MLLTKYFNSPIDLFFNTPAAKKDYSFSPNANVVETEKGFNLDIELPGIEKDQINIEVKDGYLTVKGERKSEKSEKKDGYERYESSYGKFERSWNVEDIDTDHIKAEHKNGILKIELPKKEEVLNRHQVKQIAVK